jgi:hypothetical protein
VFNHVHTPVVFGHGSCPNIVATEVWMNDSSAPKLQGAANFILQNAAGACGPGRRCHSTLPLSAIACHPWSQDLHSNLAVSTAIVCQNDGAAHG